MRVRYTSSESKDPLKDRGVKIPYAPAKRVFPKWRWYLVVLIVSSPLWFFLAKVGVEFIWATSPGIVYMDKTPINSPMSGVIYKVYLREGQKILSGDLIAKIGDPLLDVKRKPLLAERDGLLKYPSVGLASAPMRQALTLSQKLLTQEKAYLSQIQRLFDQGAATLADLNEARGRVSRAESDLLRARADLALAQVPSVEYRSQMIRLSQIEGELAAMDRLMEDIDLASPLSGVVLELFVVENQPLAQGAPMAVVADPHTASIVTFLDPGDLGMVEGGDSIKVRFPGGITIDAYMDGRPSLAQPTPSSLSTPLTDIRQSVRLKLRTAAPIPDLFLVEGLPVTVHWGGRWKWIERWLP
nr:HlyD family efflux transporter periplasmic adaptor subunit [uncultured Dethiosulfovibrio sp.]